VERIEIDGPFFSVLLCYSAISYCSLAEKWSKITAGGLQRQICFLFFFFLSLCWICKDKFAFSLSSLSFFFSLLFCFFGPKRYDQISNFGKATTDIVGPSRGENLVFRWGYRPRLNSRCNCLDTNRERGTHAQLETRIKD